LQRRMASALAFMVLIVLAPACLPMLITAAPARPLPPQARAAQASTVEACMLFKKADAAAALGGTATGPNATGPFASAPGTTMTACEYTGPGSLDAILTVTHLPGAQFSIDRSACAKSGKDVVAGIGDVACWADNTHEELHVYKGIVFISIELHGKSNPTDTIKAVAKKVVDQMK